MDDDRREAEQLAAAAQETVMRQLDVLGAELFTRTDVGWTLLAVSRGLWVMYAPCPEHGAMLTAIALLAGHAVALGCVRDAGELRRAVLASREISDTEAAELLAGLTEATLG